MKKHFKAVELNQLDESTIEDIRMWRNQPFVKEKMYSQHEITEEEHINYLQKAKKDPNRGLFVFYFDGNPFGVYQYTYNTDKRYVENGNYLISEDYQNMGYGMFLTYFQLEIIFNVLNFPKSYGEVLETNKKVISLNKKVGAELVNIQEDGREVDGKLYDVYEFMISKESWESNKRKFKAIIESFVDDFDYTKDVVI